MVRDLVEPGEFFEVFVDTPLSVCLDRDPKGLYAKARAGRVQHVTGLDSPYERPEHPELQLLTDVKSAEDLANDVIAELDRRGVLSFAS
jgi:bifunctional enzyme CysN/CysC